MTKKRFCKFVLLGSQRTISWHFMVFKIQSYHIYAFFNTTFCFYLMQVDEKLA
jgi:hypothetical protein